MKRLFWVAVGAGVTVFAVRKATELRERYSPPAVVDRAVKGATAQATTFVGRVREAAAAFGGDLVEARDRREAELHAALAAEGTSRVSNLGLIGRGYEHFTDKLAGLGASFRLED